MRKFLAWAKANPIIVISVVVAIASLGVWGYTWYAGMGLSERMAERGQVIEHINRLLNTSVRIPSPNPNEEPRPDKICVNQAAIDRLRDTYTKMNSELQLITEAMLQRNKQGKAPMEPGLFPDVPETAVLFTIKNKYRTLLAAMTGRGPANQPFLGLDAGLPPAFDTLGAALDARRRELTRGYPNMNLTTKEQAAVAAGLRRALMDQLRERVQGIHIYAGQRLGVDSPLDAGAWSDPSKGEQAAPADIWDGQMSLWIQQDIVEAIARTNHTDDPEARVYAAPIKRLLRIWIVPGYVGIDNDGGLKVSPSGMTAPAGPTFTPAPPPGGPGGGGGTAAVSAFNPVSPASRGQGPRGEILSDFVRSPTGRVSNPLFDVKHVWVSAIVDSQKLPRFYENLAQVNFMTPLLLQVHPVSEYEALQQGYLYGSGDAVQVDMLIETIWFRGWTALLMPRDVRSRLGIVLPTAGETGAVR